MEVIQSVADELLEMLKDREELKGKWCDNTYIISWTHRFYNYKKVGKIELKYQFFLYTITIYHSSLVLGIGGRLVGWYEFADPHFPDNLLADIPCIEINKEDVC